MRAGHTMVEPTCDRNCWAIHLQLVLRDHECIAVMQHSSVHGSAKPAGSQSWCFGCTEWREDELFTELPAALRAEVAGVLLGNVWGFL